MLPDKGLAAQREASEKERLAAVRAAMGPQDVEEVIQETRELKERQVRRGGLLLWACVSGHCHVRCCAALRRPQMCGVCHCCMQGSPFRLAGMNGRHILLPWACMVAAF